MSEARLVGGLEHRGAPHAQRFLRMAGVRSVEVSTVEASGAGVSVVASGAEASVVASGAWGERGGERRGGEVWSRAAWRRSVDARP